jgi:hypothetical protein
MSQLLDTLRILIVGITLLDMIVEIAKLATI